ncbi:TonB-dependent receptor [Gilvimarinus japonicus]|uniref:TonB-dependent receptor n=1 Tax=Gilvimarinus japonicus TaxID=1796469 RepID=A0ABV7HLE0_9GAMM
MFKRSVLSSAVALVTAVQAHSIYAQDDSEALLEEVVVTGIRGSLTEAIELKRENIQIVDSIVAEDIGKFPDNNVVEALQRVTGVQVTGRGAGEVNAVTIRGLGDVSTTVNGREIFTSTGRSVALADIPASLLNRADVYKTRSAEQIEGGIAGQINVLTNRPFNFDDSKFVVAARGIYQSNSEEIDPNISMLLSDRWDTSAGEFGALVNISYAETNYRDENIWIGSLDPYRYDDFSRISGDYYQVGTVEGIPSQPGSSLNVNGQDVEYYLLRDAMGMTDFTGHRERPAANVSLQWAPNDTSEYLFEAFYNGYRNESFNNLVFINTNGASHFRNPDFYDGTNVIKTNYINNASMFTSGDGSSGDTDSFVYALGGNWNIGDSLTLESELTYQTSVYERSFQALQTSAMRDRLVVDFNYDDGLPLVAFLDDATTANVDESVLTNPADWQMSNFFDNSGRDEGDAITWTMDGDYTTGWDFIERLSFGVRYDVRSALSRSRDQSSGACSMDGNPCNIADIAGLASVTQDDFLDNEANVPNQWLVADGYFLSDNAELMRGLYGLQSGGSDFLDASTFDIEETTAAAYFQADYAFELGSQIIDGQIGVRVVDTDSELSFNESAATQVNSNSSSTEVLPNFMVRYEITENLMARLSYGKSIRKPDFGQLNPTMSLTPPADFTNAEYGFANSGNPNLKAVESINTDLSLEWYFAPSSSLYGVLFSRDIDGFVFTASKAIEVTDNPDPELNAKYVLSQPSNAGKGKLNGIELGFQYFPDNVPEWLQGAGVQASYTKIDGETNDPIFGPDTDDGPGELIGYETKPLIGVSDSSYSVVLAYEKAGFDARLSYVWRDDFLRGYNANFAMPAGDYSKPEANMDFQLSYDVTESLMVTFDATNLTGEVYRGYYTDPYLYNNGASIFSKTYALGVRYSM